MPDNTELLDVMHFSPVASPHILTAALGSTLFAIKLVFLDCKSVLSKVSLRTLSANLLQQLNFHQTPNLTAMTLEQSNYSGLQTIKCYFLQEEVLSQSYAVFGSRFYTFKTLVSFN